MKKNILITGIPRSGTTLLTSLIPQNLQYTIFSEPEWLKNVRRASNNSLEFSKELQIQVDFIRKQIMAGKPIQLKVSKYNTGLPSNYYLRDKQGNILSDKTELDVIIPKQGYNSTFVIKANAQFTSCLNALVDTKIYQIICVIRNPVSAIMSWRSLKIPVSFGNLKIAEKYAEDYEQFTSKSKNLLEKQVLIADWFFKQYTEFNNNITIIRYENLISKTTGELSKVINTQSDLKLSPLSSQNKNKHYNLSEYHEIKSCMQELGHYYKQYYSLL